MEEVEVVVEAAGMVEVVQVKAVKESVVEPVVEAVESAVVAVEEVIQVVEAK